MEGKGKQDTIEIYKILSDAGKVIRDPLLTISQNTRSKGHKLKLFRSKFKTNKRKLLSDCIQL